MQKEILKWKVIILFSFLKWENKTNFYFLFIVKNILKIIFKNFIPLL
jgi:hypothetical protein